MEEHNHLVVCAVCDGLGIQDGAMVTCYHYEPYFGHFDRARAAAAYEKRRLTHGEIICSRCNGSGLTDARLYPYPPHQMIIPYCEYSNYGLPAEVRRIKDDIKERRKRIRQLKRLVYGKLKPSKKKAKS